MRTKKKNAGGRPPLYSNGFAPIAYKICLLGATLERLADLFGVSVETLYKWRDKYPEFSEALRQGKDMADAEVANSLYQRAKHQGWQKIVKDKSVTKKLLK